MVKFSIYLNRHIFIKVYTVGRVNPVKILSGKKNTLWDPLEVPHSGDSYESTFIRLCNFFG